MRRILNPVLAFGRGIAVAVGFFLWLRRDKPAEQPPSHSSIEASAPKQTEVIRDTDSVAVQQTIVHDRISNTDSAARDPRNGEAGSIVLGRKSRDLVGSSEKENTRA